MNIFQSMALWAARKAFDISITDQTAVAKMIATLGGGPTAAGVTVNESTAMQLMAVWGCVRVISETIGSLPVHIYEKQANGNALRVRDHPLESLLTISPNTDMTGQEATEAMAVNICLNGNAYSLLERAGNGSVISQTPVLSAKMEVNQRENGDIYYVYTDRGKREELPPEKVWHVKGFGNNGLIGLSPIQFARQSIGLSMAAEQFGATYFKNGAKMSGIVTVDNWLNAKQRQQAESNIEKLWQGLTNAHRIQLLEGGMKYEVPQLSMEDLQFLETRKFGVIDICRLYRVPPHMVAELDRATFSNIEEQGLNFIQALIPYLVRFERTASKRLLTPAERSRYFVSFNAEGLLRGNSTARAALYSVLLQNGVYNRNEVRAKENMPRVEESAMDDYTVQSNMALISLLEQINRAQGGVSNGN